MKRKTEFCRVWSFPGLCVSVPVGDGRKDRSPYMTGYNEMNRSMSRHDAARLLVALRSRLRTEVAR